MANNEESYIITRSDDESADRSEYYNSDYEFDEIHDVHHDREGYVFYMAA